MTDKAIPKNVMPKSKMTSSTARKLNNYFWLKSLGNFLVIDFCLVAMAFVSYFAWCEGWVPDGQEVTDRAVLGNSLATWQYVLTISDGTKCEFLIKDVVDLLRVPSIFILIAEAVILVGDLFKTGKIRQIMKPLNEIAIKAEELSQVGGSGGPVAGKSGVATTDQAEKFDSMEHAIYELNPEMPGAKITTGDADLQGLEIAINNLLERMRESQRAQARFVSDASHELRTPISVIQGYVNMLDRWGKDDEQILNESIEAIKNESEHMKNLIEQLLFLARGDSGRNTLKFEDFDLTEMVKDVFEESEMIDENHVYQFGGDGPVMVRGDVAMLKQSLRILVQNAAKYSSDGDTIKLTSTVVDGKAAYIVQDEGMGMAAADVSHVFERFYRSDAARNSSEGGTGLGLSIAKWIVDAHHGEIQVLSRPEFGTRFTVKFPLA